MEDTSYRSPPLVRLTTEVCVYNVFVEERLERRPKLIKSEPGDGRQKTLLGDSRGKFWSDHRVHVRSCVIRVEGRSRSTLVASQLDS